MDPITLIVAALVAGAAAGLQDTATSAVKDAYASLKKLISSRSGRHAPAVDAQLEAVDQAPGTVPVSLAEQLRAVGADQDPELLQAARALLKKADPDGKWQQQVNVAISNSKGVVGTNTGTVNMTFNERD